VPARPRASETSLSGKFDPLRLDILSQNLREALDARPRSRFPPAERFVGAGLYALYYTGPLDLYADLRGSDIPIYVGKAEAGNSSFGDPPDEQSPKLYDRIREHVRSIREVANGGGNLALDNFEVRYLLLDDVWIVLGERALLRAHVPVLWNTVMLGFGANPSGTRRNNARSVWDTVHAGRSRAGDICHSTLTRAEMLARIQLGIEASLMPEGHERDVALRAVRARGQKIWASPKKGAKNQRMLVYRIDEFLAENDAIGRKIQPDEWISAEGHESEAAPDPEEAAELNILDAERMEDD
jgi:hypothetical protein